MGSQVQPDKPAVQQVGGDDESMPPTNKSTIGAKKACAAKENDRN